MAPKRTGKADAKAAAAQLLEMAEKEGVTIPGNEQQRSVQAGQVLMANKKDNDFDYEAALKALTDKYPPGKKSAAAKGKEAEAEKGEEQDGEKEEAAEEVRKPAAKKRAPPRKGKAAAKKEEPEEEEDEEEEEARGKKKPAAPRKKRGKAAVVVEDEAEGGEEPTKDEGEAEEPAEEDQAAKKKGGRKPRAPPKKKVAKAKEEDEGDEEEEGEGMKGKNKAAPRKRKAKEAADEDADEEEDDAQKKKKGKIEGVCAENDALADCFRQMGGYIFKEGDSRRGAAYMKVYRGIKEYGEVITSGKQAQAIAGVGKSMAEKIQEYLTSGTITQLEELRGNGNEVM